MKTRWYKNAVIYQIYPRSFKDSNDDGIGDIKGIISKLDYIKSLNVSAVWLSPCYPSPNADNGYDISDYHSIMPDFGNLDDFKNLLSGLHERGLKLIMDLVVNHTSDEHYWFKQSRKDKLNPFRNYYIWRKGKGKNGLLPPNNWTSRFGGSAWKYDEATKEWYLHLFSEKQPDLNWDNPLVRREVINICNYWFELGVDGFRCDVITYISKAKHLPDGKRRFLLRGDEHFVLGEKIHEYLHELYENTWKKHDALIVGEGVGIDINNVKGIASEERKELDSIISFELMEVDMRMNIIPTRFSLAKFKAVINKWQKLPKDCWNTLYYENHDQPRSVSRYGKANAKYEDKLSKMLAVSLHLQRGTSYIYQGEEIAMTNCPFEYEEYRDVASIKAIELTKKYAPLLLNYVRKVLFKRARDNARTPMQWNDDKNAGFSDVTPWMKVNPNYININVQKQQDDPLSVLNFYRELVKFRKDNDIIINGEFKLYFPLSRRLFMYERSLDERSLLVICNFSQRNLRFRVPWNINNKDSLCVIHNYDDYPINMPSKITLRPYECLVYSVNIT